MSELKSIALPKPLTAEDFAEFYTAVHGFPPFAWQIRLAKQACLGEWPDFMNLPTSSGKTAAIDIAVFALAFQACETNRPNGVRTAPRRIFFVVDRRIVVNEAYRQTRDMAEKLWNAVACEHPAPADILFRVATWLRSLTADPIAPPLDCFELRGGIYRDDAWVRSPLQPTVLTSTVDQVGSRMLFRGYGVSDRNLPIHAALTTCDSLIILDEAHCSRPFSQTVEAIRQYQDSAWAEQPISLPSSLVQMTATPPRDLSDRTIFELDEAADYQLDESLQRRHGCSKPVELQYVPGAKGKALTDKLAKAMVDQALALANLGCKKIAIVVNRVAIAKSAYKQLDSNKVSKHPWLMIGRMRPIDREELTIELQQRFGSNEKSEETVAQFVVATQCLEVGADLDFDGMVTQCASLDALRQRFGRMNRLGNASICRGVVLAAEEDTPDISKLSDDKPHDPVYGNASARTWHWLNSVARESQEVDFGIKPFTRLMELHPTDLELTAPSANALVLMPAHMDMLCQTSPRPALEPDVAMYLHGTEKTLAEVQVCWRADLDFTPDLPNKPRYEKHQQRWSESVAACPPSSAELMSVPLFVLKKWLADEAVSDLASDVLGERDTSADDKKAGDPLPSRRGRCVLVWQGTQSRDNRGGSILVSHDHNLNKLRPNCTVVISAEFGGWTDFGYVPNAPLEPAFDPWAKPDDQTICEQTDVPAEPTTPPLASIDVAEAAFEISRAKCIVRAHKKLLPNPETQSLFDVLLSSLSPSGDQDVELRKESIIDAVRGRIELQATEPSPKLQLLLDPSNVQKLQRYPGGVVWLTRRQTDRTTGMPPLPLASFDDEATLLETKKLSLHQHLADVFALAQRTIDSLQMDELATSILTAAKLHDIGKVDPRFQAMLLGKPLSVAYMQRTLWAKSDHLGGHRSSELPTGFRHELLSIDLLDKFQLDPNCDTSVLRHLVASHHGLARPLVPVAIDQTLPGFSLKSFGGGTVSHEERATWTPGYELASRIAGRFWELNRRFGWWGLALLESTLRLADWAASANPNQGNLQSVNVECLENNGRNSKPVQQSSVVLSGIDGTRPLGFLAALGAFATLDRALPRASLKFSWTCEQGGWRPVVSSQGDLSLNHDSILDLLLQQLTCEDDRHPALRIACKLSDVKDPDARRLLFQQFVVDASVDARRDADWASCNGSEVVSSDAISQLQTSRRDYHSIAISGLLEATAASHLERTLFHPWDYADPIAGVSLHLEPREDRRHAYQWHTPSGDPTRKSFGGMIGANRLALEAWPLFQSLPAGDRLQTVGFRGLRASNTYFTWPLWNAPIPIAVVQSLLSLRELHDENGHANLYPIGISKVCRSQRILVGKTPNLTPATALAF